MKVPLNNKYLRFDVSRYRPTAFPATLNSTFFSLCLINSPNLFINLIGCVSIFDYRYVGLQAINTVY